MEPVLIAVLVGGVQIIINWSVRAYGSARLSSAEIPAEFLSETLSLQTAWILLTDALSSDKPALTWSLTLKDAVLRRYDEFLAIAKHWDHVVAACRDARNNEQATHAHRQNLHRLRWCFIMWITKAEDAITSGALDPSLESNTLFGTRYDNACTWLDHTYPVIETNAPLLGKSINWSHNWAALRASGNPFAILVPGKGDSTRVLYGTGPNSKRPGYAFIKYQQMGLPEVLSAPAHFLLKVTWWRNWTRRRALEDFKDWDMWRIMPAFIDEIPYVDVPGKMALREGDCIKIACLDGTRVIARTFWFGMPKLVMSPYKRYDHAESTFVLKAA